jgi:hypothetical protein
MKQTKKQLKHIEFRFFLFKLNIFSFEDTLSVTD